MEKKKIKEIKERQEVLSSEEKTGKIVPNKVNALLDMGNKTIFEVTTESGRNINTTENYHYLVKLEIQSAVAIPSLLSTNVFPLNLSENSLIKLRSKDSTSEILRRCIRITTIAGNCEGGNKDVFKKSLSSDNKTRCSSHANEYNLEFLMPFGANFMSTSSLERNLTNLASTSSSAKNLSFNINESFTSQSFSSGLEAAAYR